jgi:hypothetical protein
VCYVGWKIRIATVAMKPIPSARAMSLRRFFSIATFPSFPVEEKSSSDVTRSIIAVTASQSPMSDTDSGNLIDGGSLVLLSFLEAVGDFDGLGV